MSIAMTAAMTAKMTAVFDSVLSSTDASWEAAWIGMEPTFTNPKTLRLWKQSTKSDSPEAENAFFEHPYTQGLLRTVAKTMQARFEKARRRGEPLAIFDRVQREKDVDQWQVPRQNLHFRCDGIRHRFTVRFGLDPETCEFSIKPVPLAWFYDRRFVAFLEEIVWGVPLGLGLLPSILHGGAQFSVSAKTYLKGSLLCDDIADKLAHPELSTFMMDYPNCDDRSFRATAARRDAFQRIIDQYWAGAFHPRVIGPLTVENAYWDRGFAPAVSPPSGLMDPVTGPTGTPEEIFQTNFAFGRAVRLLAQNIHPGYWQSAHPTEVGYRPDQIMRYSEGNLNRLRVVGELHVKSDKVLDLERVPELSAPLTAELLYHEASWENRGQAGRTSARDFVEAMLLDIHRARYLQAHPGPRRRKSLLQDQLLAEAESTLLRHGGAARLDELRKEARQANAEASRGRIKSDFIEPETLFWEAFRILPTKERAALACEAIENFVTRVTEAAECDPRPRHSDGAAPVAGAHLDTTPSDPMEWHRHRIHPVLWGAVVAEPSVLESSPIASRELGLYRQAPERYQARRARPGITKKELPPWEGLPSL